MSAKFHWHYISVWSIGPNWSRDNKIPCGSSDVSGDSIRLCGLGHCVLLYLRFLCVLLT